MALHLIIDGYNMIRALEHLNRAEQRGLDLGRQALLTSLAGYKKNRPGPITVVFDAQSQPHLQIQTDQARGIKVLFSPSGQTADQVIVRLVQRQSSQALVVTNDRELSAAVTAAGGAVVSCADFDARINLAAVMAGAGTDSDTNEPQPRRSTRKKGPQKRLSKAQRQKINRLSKI